MTHFVLHVVFFMPHIQELKNALRQNCSSDSHLEEHALKHFEIWALIHYRFLHALVCFPLRLRIAHHS